MERWRGRVAVVTGASSGIGAAITYQLQDAGLIVVALARRSELISTAVEKARKEAKGRGRAPIGEASTPGQLHVLKCDISREEDIVAAFQWVQQSVGGVDILVNNAGIPTSSALTDRATDQWKSVLDVNVLGLSICTREAVQQMKKRGVDDGHIVHMGSRLGHDIFNMPGAHILSASKHAVRVLTEGLRKELVAAKSHIRVTEVSPGVVFTDFINKMQKEEVLASLGYTGNIDYSTVPHLNAEDVADAVLYAIASPAHVQIHEIIIAPVGEAWK